MLVIVALLVGGVIVGREMIANAQMRSSMTAIEAYKTAFGAFRGKYNCLPGDCTNGVNFGVASVNGNGNQQIDGIRTPGSTTGGQLSLCTSCGAAISSGGVYPPFSEISMALESLSRAKLVKDDLVVFTASATSYYGTSKLFPKLATQAHATFFPASHNGITYFRTIVGNAGADGSMYFSGYALSPIQAANLSQKLGDGSVGRNFTSFAITSQAAGANSANTDGGNYNMFASLPNLKSLVSNAAISCVNDTVTPYIWDTSNNNAACDLMFRIQ